MMGLKLLVAIVLFVLGTLCLCAAVGIIDSSFVTNYLLLPGAGFGFLAMAWALVDAVEDENERVYRD